MYRQGGWTRSAHGVCWAPCRPSHLGILRSLKWVSRLGEGQWARLGGLLLLPAHLPYLSPRIPAFLNSLTFNYYLASA